MIEVFVFGVFVAHVKLGDLVHISLGVGVVALLCLTFVMVWADSALDRHAVWEALGRETPPEHPMHRVPPSSRFLAGAVGCETCGLVSASSSGAERDHARAMRPS